MPWLSKKRIAYAAGNSSARPGAVDQSAEVSGTRKWRRKRTGVAVLVEVLGQRLRLVPGPRSPQPAPDLPQQPDEAGPGEVRGLRERPPAGVLEAAAGAADRERHVRLVCGDAQLAKETTEQWIVALVVDEEAGIESKAVVDDRVRVPTCASVALEHVDVVRPREEVRRAQARYAATDDRDFHQPLFVRRRIPVDRPPPPL